MKNGLQDLWPDARGMFYAYLAGTILLGSVAVVLEAVGVGQGWIVVIVAVMVLPFHYGVNKVRRRLGRSDGQTKEPPPPPRDMAAAAGVD